MTLCNGKSLFSQILAFRYSVWDLRKITEQGVKFRSPIDGSLVELTPERSMEVQRALGADIVMIFDECTPYPATEPEARSSMELSLRWAKRSKEAHGDSPSALFGIIQGNVQFAQITISKTADGGRVRWICHWWIVSGRA